LRAPESIDSPFHFRIEKRIKGTKINVLQGEKTLKKGSRVSVCLLSGNLLFTDLSWLSSVYPGYCCPA
jgi:hypothetical protein